MKRLLLTLITLFVFGTAHSQLTIDTLAMQNFDTVVYSPNWPFTGPVVYNTMGVSPAASSPSNSPTGIGNTRSWESTTQSAGLILTFTTINIPAGYDSIRAHFSLAAMNLISTGGGPDNLDYVLTEVSFNGGPFYSRLRIRGAVANNSWWPYAATGVAKVYYQPQSEVVFAPTNSGLQTTEGYSFCEIVFPGSINQISIRMTGRSSSSTDSWLVDNVMLTGEKLATGVSSIQKNSSVKIYPNPANDVIHIVRNTNKLCDLTILNAIGQVVLSKELSKATETINISEFPAGIYFLNVDGTFRKIVKQ